MPTLIMAVQCILQKVQAIIELSVLFQFNYLIFIFIKGAVTKYPIAEYMFCCTFNPEKIAQFDV